MLSLFKKKKTNIRNCHHPDFAHLVEKAFVGHGVDGNNVQYYKFKGNTEMDMIAGRYNVAIKFFHEASMRMSAEDLNYYIDQIEQTINNPREIKISIIAKWIGIIKDRTQLLIDNNTAMKLASASYFDENEVLDGYDFGYNMKKIEAWQKGGDYSFFFMKPMIDLLPLPKSWQEDFGAMENYMSLAQNVIESRMNAKS